MILINANGNNNIPIPPSSNHSSFIIPLNLFLFLFILANLLRAEKNGQAPGQASDNDGADDEETANLPFTDCDHVFDGSLRRGHFSLPIFPRQASADISADFSAGADGMEDGGLEERSTFPPFVTLASSSRNDEEATMEEGERDAENGQAGGWLVRYQSLPENIQCIYTFVARPNERVRLEFGTFQLAGTANHCESEYVDVYSELMSPTEDLLSANLGARYCGTVAPNVRISLHNVLVLVLHSLVGRRRTEPFVLAGRFQFVPEAPYLPGDPLLGGGHPAADSRRRCAFLIESSKNRAKGTILSPTYPGAYPNNFHCIYLLRGSSGERIRLFFRDFDVYFGGEHCPYDSVTIYDGGSTSEPILRKLCGLQQRLELFSFGNQLLLEFNTTEPPKNDLRGFVIEYEFSNRFVDVSRLIANQRSISHLRGSECDIRVRSNRESIHYIHSPNYPAMFPPNTTCTYVLDGLQSDQNLEKVLLRFETFAMPSAGNSGGDHQLRMANNARPSNQSASISPSSLMASAPTGMEECSSGSFIGIATTAKTIKAVMGNSEESVYDAILCHRLPPGSPKLGPYVSQGPRIVLIFSSMEAIDHQQQLATASPNGFRARVEFKTDFGIAGESIGGSNRCAFRFRDASGSFNSPRYPANYPLDTECTYQIVGQPGKQILLHFKQFALFEDNSKEECNDWLQIFDVFHESDGSETQRLQAKHCWHVFPGPTISAYGAHEMRVIFHSDGFGTANGFDAHYEIRDAFEEEVPTAARKERRHCGELIEANDQHSTGHFESPGYPIKYEKNKQCDWEIRVRAGHQVLLKPNAFNVEGQMTEEKVDCMSAVLRVHLDLHNRSGDLQLCGENMQMIPPIVSPSNSIRLSFLTSPDKVNGLQGFNFSWTEVRRVQSDSECSGEQFYLCSYTRLCIDSKLRCNGEENCGENDDSDEAHCSRIESQTDKRTIIIAYIVSGLIFFFILSFFCFLFKSKLFSESHKKKEEKRRKRQLQNRRGHKGSGRHRSKGDGMIGIGRTRSSQRRRVGGEGGDWRGTMDGNENDGTMPRPRHNPFRAQKSKQTALLDRHRPSGMLFSMGGAGAGRMGMLGEEEDEGSFLNLPIFDHQFEQQQQNEMQQHHPNSHQFMRLPTVEEQLSPVASTGTGAASLALGDIPSTIEADEEDEGEGGQKPTGLDDTRILYA